MVCEILKTKDIARVIGCPTKQVRHDMRHGVMPFGKVVKAGSRKRYIATISELAEFLQLSREKIIERLEEK